MWCRVCLKRVLVIGDDLNDDFIIYKSLCSCWSQKVLWLILNTIICTFLGIMNDMHLKTSDISLKQTVYTVCFYSVYWSMSLVDTWLQPLWLVCLMVPEPLWFPSPPWWWCEAQRWQSLHIGFHLHSSRSTLKSSGFKFMLSCVWLPIRNFALNQRFSFWEGESLKYSITQLDKS